MKKTTVSILVIILAVVVIVAYVVAVLYKDAKEDVLPDVEVEEPENDIDEEVDIDEENDIDEDADVRVTTPWPNEEVSFPLTVAGEARGNWFFEAEINLRLLDNEGNEVAAGFALSQDEEWMTMDFVAFEGEITGVPEGARGGTLIIEENNPASPEERGREVWTYEIPVIF